MVGIISSVAARRTGIWFVAASWPGVERNPPKDRSKDFFGWGLQSRNGCAQYAPLGSRVWRDPREIENDSSKKRLQSQSGYA
jgi:hypothetical protein